MIEPSDMERAELPETTANYIEDLEAEIERKDELIRQAIWFINQVKEAHAIIVLNKALQGEEEK